MITPVISRCNITFLTCLGNLGWRDTGRFISIGQGKLIRHDIAGVIAPNIMLNFANVNSALQKLFC